MEQGSNDRGKGKQKCSLKTPSDCHFVTRFLTWSVPASNADFRGENPATNRLCLGAFRKAVLWQQVKGRRVSWQSGHTRRGRDMALHSFNLGDRMGRVVNATSRPLYPWETSAATIVEPQGRPAFWQ